MGVRLLHVPAQHPVDHRRGDGIATLIRIFVIVAALGTAVLPVEPRVVERWFSRTWYPPLQRVLTPLANAVGWSLFDVTCVAVGVAAVTMVVTRVRGAKGAARRGRWWRAAFDLVALGAAVYLVFMATWGWHYRREPLGVRLDVRADGVTAERVRELTDTAIFHLNSLHASAHARAWPSPVAWATVLAPAFGAAQQALGVEPAAVPARPKPTAFGAWFVRAGIAGMTNPFQLDVMLTPDALPFEVPAMLAHEWAHVAGFAREDEAGFVGFVTTQQGDVQAQYSGWLEVYGRLLAALPRAERDDMHRRLAAGPRADLAAIRQRLTRVSPAAQQVAWSGYDSYLKSNRVREGLESYDGVVDLMARARFDEHWRPALAQ